MKLQYNRVVTSLETELLQAQIKYPYQSLCRPTVDPSSRWYRNSPAVLAQ